MELPEEYGGNLPFVTEQDANKHRLNVKRHQDHVRDRNSQFYGVAGRKNMGRCNNGGYKHNVSYYGN